MSIGFYQWNKLEWYMLRSILANPVGISYHSNQHFYDTWLLQQEGEMVVSEVNGSGFEHGGQNFLLMCVTDNIIVYMW